MSWFFDKTDFENGKADCIFCGEPVRKSGDGFVVQQVEISNKSNLGSRYRLNGQRKFMAHNRCLSKAIFSKQFLNVKIEESLYEFIQPKRKNKEIVWSIENLIIDDKTTQEDVDLASSKIAKNLLAEE